MSTPPPAPQPGPPAAPPERVEILAWAGGLAVLLCVPYFVGMLAGLLMVLIGLTTRRKGPLTAENGRRAANWGLTFGLVSVVTAGVFFAMLFGSEDPNAYSGLPLGTPPIIWLAFAAVHLVLTIIAMARGGSGRLAPALGIPYFRVKGWHKAA